MIKIIDKVRKIKTVSNNLSRLMDRAMILINLNEDHTRKKPHTRMNQG